MDSLERKQEEVQKPDLQPLREMVGVKRGLETFFASNSPVDKKRVVGLLKTQRDGFVVLGKYEKKAQALGQIIEGLENGTVDIDEVIQATGVVRTTNSLKRKGFLGRFGR